MFLVTAGTSQVFMVGSRGRRHRRTLPGRSTIRSIRGRLHPSVPSPTLAGVASRKDDPSPREWTEGGEHHVPVGGRAEGQAPLLRAGGAGEDVLDVGGGAPVLHVVDVLHPLAASVKHPTRLAAGEDGRHD